MFHVKQSKTEENGVLCAVDRNGKIPAQGGSSVLPFRRRKMTEKGTKTGFWPGFDHAKQGLRHQRVDKSMPFVLEYPARRKRIPSFTFLERKIEMKKNRILQGIAVLLFTVLTLSISMAPTGAAETDSQDSHDDVTLNFHEQADSNLEALLLDATTYVPFRAFFETVWGGSVTWDSETETATASSDTLVLTAKPDDSYLMANGRCLYGEASAVLIDGRLYVPIRLMAKAMGLSVHWNAEETSVTLSGEKAAIQSGDDFYDESEVYWLSRIIYAEAGAEPLSGQIAVGNVVLNRVNDSAYPDTIYGVIFDKKFGVQFTPAQNGAIYKTPTEESVLAAKACLDGFSYSDSALYFYDPDLSTTSWMEDSCQYEFTIGCHRFFS